jgi:hypothetical protein
VGKAWGLIWLDGFIGLVGGVLGLVFEQTWWPTLAITSAAISLVAIVPWWNSVIPGANYDMGAFEFNWSVLYLPVVFMNYP